MEEKRAIIIETNVLENFERKRNGFFLWKAHRSNSSREKLKAQILQQGT